MSRYAVFAIVALGVLLFDQYSKFLVLTRMGHRDVVEVVGGFFNIVSVRNPGAAFGVFAAMTPFFRMSVFIGVAVLATVFIAYHLVKAEDGGSWTPITLALIFGGMLGNTVDRCRFGEVVDFIDWYVGPWHWPAFNIADAALLVGSLMLLSVVLRRQQDVTIGKH